MKFFRYIVLSILFDQKSLEKSWGFCYNIIVKKSQYESLKKQLKINMEKIILILPIAKSLLLHGWHTHWIRKAWIQILDHAFCMMIFHIWRDGLVMWRLGIRLWIIPITALIWMQKFPIVILWWDTPLQMFCHIISSQSQMEPIAQQYF